MRKSILRASAGLQALALMGAGTAASFIVAAPAAAQDYTSGAISGTITDGAGHVVPGATVVMRSASQGQTRTFTTSGSGTFSANGLAPGEYAITVTAPSFRPYEDTLTVTAAQQSQVTVDLISEKSGNVVVVGRRLRQTTTQATTGLAVDIPALTQNVAVPRDITGVTLLAPTTARGNTGFTSTSGEPVPSIGGGSVAENAYYINGLNITNPDTYIGSARVPFDFFKTVDVQTGGYPAEFGRATGGVVNATTKSGSNVPFVAMHVNWQPSGLQSHRPNTGQATNPVSVGKLSSTDLKEVTLEAGGAAIPDHVFLYGLLEARRDRYTFGSQRSGTYHDQRDNDPFWGAKADVYINPTQHAEFTIFDTRSVIQDRAYQYHSTRPDFTGGIIGTPNTAKIEQGGLNWVGRYTGDVTDFLTLSAAYGVSKDRSNTVPPNPDLYYVVDTSAGNADRLSLGQPFLTSDILETRRRFYRADADLRVNFAGQHHFRFGFDNEDLSERKTTDINGAAAPVTYTYDENGVDITYEHMGGAISATDTAFYAEDSWNTPLEGLTLNLGIRDDIFKQYNLSGEQYANLKNNWGPRVSFAYTPPGLEKWKFFGSWGRYFIPPGMNLGFRGKDTYFDVYYNYPTPGDRGSLTVDPSTGLPNAVGTPMTTAELDALGLTDAGFDSPCPTVDLSAAPGGLATPTGNVCAVYGSGIQDPALAKFARSAKASYEDEMILGARYRVNSLLSVGLQGTYRKLKRVSEDSDFEQSYIDYWCGPNGGLAGAKDAEECAFYQANPAYHIWNVGDPTIQVNDFYQATLGKVLPVTLKNPGDPKASRTYKAIVLDFARADDGRWLAGGSLTWSKLKGNTEGTVRSDVGNGVQTDAGATIDFDYPGLADYSYGYLANDHRWALKLFGAYHFGKMFTLGANVLVQSPGHGSCLGINPRDPSAAGYGPYSFYCGSGLATDPDNGRQYYQTNVPSPRGTGFKTDWLKQLDLSARAKLPFGATDNRYLQLRADVFNVFNSHAVIQRNGVSETAAGAPDGGYYKSLLFLTPNAYQSPRYVRLGLDFVFGGATHVAEPAPVVAPPPPPPAAPATQTCADGTVILATDACPVPPPPPPPPPPPAASGERGQ